MSIMFIDYETHYTDDYSLKKMTPIEYIMHPQFEALGCAFADEGGSKMWIDGPELPSFFEDHNWRDTTVVSHNALFDALILAYRYGIYPKAYGCTLSMARNWVSHQINSLSLASVSKRYGLPEKMDTLVRTKGVNFHELKNNPVLHQEVKTYGIDDVMKCRSIYKLMMDEGFPEEQLEVIDWVVRMAAIPQLELDLNVVAQHLSEVIEAKATLLANAGLDTRDSLMRDEVLAAALTLLGVDVPRKLSKTTGKEQWAFAKTDKAFTALQEHINPSVQALVAARLGHKSTLEETRAQRFMAIGQLTKRFPVPLKYSGAHTHRFSGDWKINVQNLPTHGSTNLRKALRAPAGCVVVSVDASQIEARLNATLSGQLDLVESFRRGEDVYCEFASLIYNRPITKAQNPSERFVGKTGILSLGYSSSWPVFQNMVRVKGDGIALSDHMASTIVMTYRNRYPMIVEHWKEADRVILPMIAEGRKYQWGALEVGLEKLTLPNGNALRYRQLKHAFDNASDRYGWTYMRGDVPHKVYGAKVVENECQSLAFVHLTEVAMKVKHMTDGLLVPVHQVHDELIYVVPEKIAEQARDLVVRVMSEPPEWLPTVPFAAEGHIGDSYGSVK